MKSILITGVTGFVGSALAARFLREGHRVLALSRQDPQGERTRAAVQAAAIGFGYAFGPEEEGRLQILSVNYTDLDALLASPDFLGVDEAWHSAAEMTYNPRKLEKALAQNLKASVRLHQLLDQHTRCQRFYYISTAYTAGMQCDIAEEKLHLAPNLINVYQTSKWSAEMGLAQSQMQGRLPVTIFRPSVVVGHQESGWHGKSVFGFYSFLRAILFARYVGCRQLHLDLDPKAELNLVPVDVVCEYAAALSNRASISHSLEVFHAAASSSFNIQEISSGISDRLAFPVLSGKASCRVARDIDQRVQQNAEFARRSWTFQMLRMKESLGEDFVPFHMNQESLKVLIDRFTETQLDSFRPRTRSEGLKLGVLRLQLGWEEFWRGLRMQAANLKPDPVQQESLS